MTDRLSPIDVNPRFEDVGVGAIGTVYTIARSLSDSVLSLGAGTHGNLTLVGTAITAVAALAPNDVQVAVVHEANSVADVSYRVNIRSGAVVRPKIFNLKASNTVRIRAGMAAAAAGTRSSIIPIIGPSTSAGQSTGGGLTQAVNAWPMQLAARLQASGINAGANNFFGSKGAWGLALTIANFLTGDGRMSASGAFAFGATESAGGNAFNATAAGSLGFTPQGNVTKFDVWWRDNGTGRQFNMQVDGGAATLVSSTGATAPVKTTIAAGSSAAHALLLSWVAGSVTVIGVNAYDDTAGRKEISLLNFGISGAVTGQFINNVDGAGGRYAMLVAVQPDGAILDDLPINDWRQSIAIATAKANIKTLNAQVRAAGGDPILTTPLYDSGTGGLSAQQDSYAAMLFDVATEDDVPLIDIRAAWGSYATASARGWYSDSVHPTRLGYAVKADMVQSALTAIRALS